MLAFWVVLLFALFSLSGFFDSPCLSEVIAEEVLSKLRGTHKVYLRHVENSSKEVYNILETVRPIIRLNTLKTSIVDKIGKIKGLDEQLLEAAVQRYS